MKKLITEADIFKLQKEGKHTLTVAGNEIFTPSALDRINSSKIKIEKKTEDEIASGGSFPDSKFIAIGSDHTGYDLKTILIVELKKLGFEILDAGTNNKESCDYPDFAAAVAKEVALRKVKFGIVIDATGNPSAITANKMPGIRAANCFNEFTAVSARSHNNANILVLGAKAIGEETAKSVLQAWLKTDFEGGRHQRRLDKITEFEKYFLNRTSK